MNTIKLIAVASMLSLTVGCVTTTDPYSGEEKFSNTAKGAGIGAAVGGIAGALMNKNDRGKGALIGAAVGAGAGGGVGYYMDQQEAKLRQTLEGTGVSISRNGERITLNMPGDITFDTGSSAINQNFYGVLNSVGMVLQEFNQSDIQVAGHTDNTGSREFNQRLSEQRATAVSNYLGRGTIDPRRTYAVGYGEDRPIANNNTASGRAQNRRVELQLMPPRS